MQHYLIVWTFPTVEGAWESCPGFADYINSGAPGDAFDGFALKYRVCEPISGSGVAIAVASDIGKVWAHLGPWIKDFGIQFEVTAVVSDAEFGCDVADGASCSIRQLRRLSLTPWPGLDACPA